MPWGSPGHLLHARQQGAQASPVPGDDEEDADLGPVAEDTAEGHRRLGALDPLVLGQEGADAVSQDDDAGLAGPLGGDRGPMPTRFLDADGARPI